MGRSAKVHKRTPKKLRTPATSSAAASAQSHAQNAKKKAAIKDKTGKGRGASAAKGEGPVLGGADYVSLMMGGRRKAREEAEKLPRKEGP